MWFVDQFVAESPNKQIKAARGLAEARPARASPGALGPPLINQVLLGT
jgi:hypothetical protein